MINREFPYTLILLFIMGTNLFFSTYFVSVFLAGVVFAIFNEVFKKENFYLTTIVIFTFLVIETIQGMKLFSLTLISFFLYFFIIPKLKHTFSSNFAAKIFYILCFYICLYAFSFFTGYYMSDMNLIFILNFLLDSLLVGFFL